MHRCGRPLHARCCRSGNCVRSPIGSSPIGRLRAKRLPICKPRWLRRTRPWVRQSKRPKLQPVLQQFPSHVPSHVPALLLQARLFAARGDIATALSKVDALLAQAPDNPHAWQLRGDLLARQRNPDPAAWVAYRRELALRPDQMPAQAGLISVLLRAGDVAGARQQANAMLAIAPARSADGLFACSSCIRRRQSGTSACVGASRPARIAGQRAGSAIRRCDRRPARCATGGRVGAVEEPAIGP